MADLFATLDRLGIHPDKSARHPNAYTLHLRAPTKGEARPVSGTSRGPTTPASCQWSFTFDRVRQGAFPDAIRIGDCVVIQYLDDRKQLTLTLTKDRHDIPNGYLPVTSLLGRQLPGASQDDEIEVNIGDRIRRALILRAHRAVQAQSCESDPAKPLGR
jgi:hypothetical protein